MQHAYNPVNWLPYSESVFNLAQAQNKPVLISIGYSACHWCHVMEKECFEDQEVADLMNQHFVNVKVDREERNDVDMVYMQAVQMMKGQGGWPLNCFVLPNGKPFYGGTYFPKKQWLHLLEALSKLYHEDSKKVNDYADELTQGIIRSNELVTSIEQTIPFGKSKIKQAVENWKKDFDSENGGPNRAPKFPLPSNYLFLLRYASLSGDFQVKDHVKLTLTKMAKGGIYDQLRGGFSRYSTDMEWKVPHFEKMLYDNAQLVSLYSEAYLQDPNPLYKAVVYETLNFVKTEWMHSESGFYSALDADSDGEEGKYYVWTEEELKEVLGKDFDLFQNVFEINALGYWEHDNYILMQKENTLEYQMQIGLSQQEILEKINSCKQKLKIQAQKRTKPALDDKTICSWNALMCSAYTKAYLSFGEKEFKHIAINSLEFILNKMRSTDGGLNRTYKDGVSKIPAFLEDYSFVIEALLNAYLIENNENYLIEAKNLMLYCLKNFENPNSPFLFYTNVKAQGILTRTTEVSDNVIPASNSQMALNLFYLSRYFQNSDWELRALKMLDVVTEDFLRYPSGYSHWAILGLHVSYPFFELAIVGKDVDEKMKELYQLGLTNTILALSRKSSEMALLKNRFSDGKTLYICLPQFNL